VPDPALAEADVAFGQPDAAGAMASPRLRWIQVPSAGYATYDNDAFWSALRRRGALFTNSSAVFAEPCAEHALAFILAQARQLPQSFAGRLEDTVWPSARRRAECRLLLGQRAVFLGFGAIGRRLAQLLSPFEMEIAVVRRHVRGDEQGVKAITAEHLDEALAGAGHVVNLLPESAGTRHFFNASRFAAMRRGAVFYNIGRGVTVDQGALLEALRSGRIAAAYLDVTEPEPLPPEHPLWSAPNCFFTPHTAGGHHDEAERLVRHFLANLERFMNGRELEDRVV